MKIKERVSFPYFQSRGERDRQADIHSEREREERGGGGGRWEK